MTRHLDAFSAIATDSDATAIMPPIISCFLINHEHKLDFGRVAHVAISADTDVYNLTESIKVDRLENLAHVDADRLEVWKSTNPVISKPRTTERINELLNRIEFSENSDTVELLGSAQNLMSLNLPNDPFLFVRVLPLPQMPGTTSFVFFHWLIMSNERAA